jgi:hypothetical protein
MLVDNNPEVLLLLQSIGIAPRRPSREYMTDPLARRERTAARNIISDGSRLLEAFIERRDLQKAKQRAHDESNCMERAPTACNIINDGRRRSKHL